eukprot:jgi/Bigna1/69012/fgenesh1_pg.7_\
MNPQNAFQAVQLSALIILMYSLWILITAETSPIHIQPKWPEKFKGSNAIASHAIIDSSNITTRKTNLEPHKYEDPDVFAPGSLKMSQLEAFSKCYIDPIGMYRTHFGDGLCVVSDSKKFVFYHVRKSGSSTGRSVATQQFGGRDMQRCDHRGKRRDEFYKVAFVRNPTTRFFAQYEETFVRTLGGKMKIPDEFDVFHKDMKDYKEYEKLFCGESASLPRKGRKKPCDQIPSQDTGNLARRFERFIDAWDGTVFEAHLAMQAPILSNRNTGLPFALDYLGNTKTTDSDWQQIGNKLGVMHVETIRGRAYPRRMNISYISKGTYEKMCRLAAIDYCCLNFKLPPECTNAGVSCRWISKDGSKRIVPEVGL